MAFNNTIIARVAASVWGLKLGNGTMNAALQQANTAPGGLNAVINGAFNDSYSQVDDATISSMVVANLGLTGAAATAGTAYLTAALNAVPDAERGATISEVVALFSGLTADPTYGAAATAFNAKVAAAAAYSATAGTLDAVLGSLPSANSFNLTMGVDNLTGTAGNDTFTAYIFDNQNSLQSADQTHGGAGTADTLFADMGASQAFAVTPITTGIENIIIRAESEAVAQGQNNVGATGRVQIDAERITGATWFESNNSRSDVIIEDVRILPSQITKDITVAWVESDPGHVDYGLYFDQLSLRNQTSASSSINLQIMDTGATARGQAPLLDSNYRAFTFTVQPPGAAARVVTLGSDAIQAATTYVQLAAAFQTELNREFGPGVATATVGANFTIIDPLSGAAVTGQTIVLSTNTATAFTTPAGSGWLSDGTAPPASNFYTNFTTGQSSSADLVTVKVVLDDVGRGSTGGDLVIGGLSTGVTSSSLGVQRFEVEVRDNSKLESLKSTNNTLREITIVNGVTSNSGNAYITTTKDAGSLTINGNSGANGANITGTGATGVGAVDAQAGNNTPLPNSSAVTNFGITDVRLIDGSTMTGQLAYSAEVTNASLAKYLNLRDIQALPAGDNIAFTYNGGTAADRLWVALDSTATSSRNTIMAGREDFTFTTNGGAGNDNLIVFVNNTTLPGGFQNWYLNQSLNRNITVNGDAGDDTIRTPGAGDKIINGGVGNDTVYADNTGTQANTSATASRAGAVYTAAEAAELAQVLDLVRQSNSTNSDLGAAFQAPLGQPDLTVATLDALNLLTPVSFTDPAIPANPNPLLPTKAVLQAAVDAAFAAGAITVQQQLSLYTAYGLATGMTITTPGTLVVPTLTGAVAPVVLTLSAAEFAAGNTALDALIVAAKAAAATADAVDARALIQTGLLNATQVAVVNADMAVNAVASAQLVAAPPGFGLPNGTLTNLTNLNALKAALVVGASDVAVVTALTAAVANGAITGPLAAGQSAALYAASGATGVVGNLPIDANELGAIQLILEPLIATATALNNTAQAALTAAITANNTAVRAAAAIVGADPDDGGVADVAPFNQSAVVNDAVGRTETAAAATAAVAARDALVGTAIAPAPGTQNFLTTIQTDLVALKAALATGITELNFSLLTTAAVAKGTITAADKIAIDAAGDSAVPAFPGTNLTAVQKQAVDVLIQALQETNTAAVDNVRAQVAILQAAVDATALASAQAASAFLDAPVAGAPTVATDKAVWVLNTSNQLDVTLTPGTGYVLTVNDERNVTDLRSDTNEVRNFFNTTVTVTFKDLVATALVPNTGFRTSDLQVNQAIKDAINNNAVLNKLIVATDGPANTLVITSLIDGVMSTANLSIGLTLPTATALASTDISGAAAAYGLPAGATAADVLVAMTTALAAFNTDADYIDQLAETGAFGGNVRVTGAASVSTADNTITPGDGNDVIVLGTTSDPTGSSLLSSNDTVVYGALFGNDTIVHFKAGSLGTGGDILNLTALGGNILGTAFNVNRSVNVANEVTATNGTATLVAGLFTDSATAQTHVYVAVDPLTNIGKVYSVVDAVGVGAGSVTATLAGTIDLADTLWSTLTVDNFA